MQIMRYIIVGLVSNSMLFILYLLATSHGIGHKAAMSLLYVIGIIQTFIFNRRWSFSSNSSINSAFCRYFAVYGIGYFLNLTILTVFVDGLGWPHQYVQGVTILIIAIALFLAQKFWVFPEKG